MNNLIDYTKAYIRDKFLIKDGGSVIVGFSGGADSTALLSILKELGYDCKAAHCNFHLRGEESMRDELFCMRFCAEHDVVFLKKDFDVKDQIEKTGESTEMACRTLRYEWWEELLNDEPHSVFALGHHADDDIETLFLNLLRGSGVSGLKGMLPKRARYIRPLLGVRKIEILDYLRERSIEYVTDSSNNSIDFLRNKLRNIILPEIYSQFPGSDYTMIKSLACLKDDFMLRHSYLEELKERFIGEDGRIFLSKIIASEQNARLVLFELLKEYGFSMDQSSAIINIQSEDGRTKSGLIFESREKRFLLDRGVLLPHSESKDTDETEVTLFSHPFKSRIISFEEFNRLRAAHKLYSDRIYLDEKVLENSPRFIVRSWHKGDRFNPFGMKGSKLVSDLLNDAKLSLLDKQKIKVLLRNDEIIWVIGMRASCRFSVTEDSGRIIELSFSGC